MSRVVGDGVRRAKAMALTGQTAVLILDFGFAISLKNAMHSTVTSEATQSQEPALCASSGRTRPAASRKPLPSAAHKIPVTPAPSFGASIDPDRRRLNAGGGFPSVRTDFGPESQHIQFHETRRQDCTGDRGDQRNRRIPLHREGTPDQVASLIVELVKNDYITGETFTIDGGLTMRIA